MSDVISSETTRAPATTRAATRFHVIAASGELGGLPGGGRDAHPRGPALGVAEASASFAFVESAVLRVTVQDRGRSASTWTPGVGIASMRERVEQVGGRLTVDARPVGATVTAEMPISP